MEERKEINEGPVIGEEEVNDTDREQLWKNSIQDIFT